MTTRNELARAAFWGQNPALMDHLYEMDGQLTVDTAPTATLTMDLARAIELVEGMSEQEYKDLVTLGIIPAPTVTKRIGEYDRDSKDFPAYVVFEDGSEELIGYRKTVHDAELLASAYIIDHYSENTPEKAAQLIMEEVEEEARQSQAAADMGGVWEVVDTETERVIDCHPTQDGANQLAAQKRQLHGEYGRYIVRNPSAPAAVEEAERIEAEAENEPRETTARRTRGAFAAISNEALINWPPPTEAALNEIAAGLSGDDVVRLAIAMSHIPLPNEERYGHKEPADNGSWPTLGDLRLLGVCPACGGAHKPTQCPQIGGAMLQPYCDGQAGPCGRFGRHDVLALMGSSDGRPLWETLHFCDAHLAQWEATATRCPSCNDPVRTPGALCPACQESGEGKRHIHVNADVNGGEYKPARDAANAIIAAREVAR